MMRANTWTTSCVAYCTICGWETQDQENGKQKARAHSKRTGHSVSGETVRAFNYSYPVPDPKSEAGYSKDEWL